MKRTTDYYKIAMLVIITIMITLLVSSVVIYNYFRSNPNVKYVLAQNEDGTTDLEAAIKNMRAIIDQYYLYSDDIDENDMVEGAIKGYVEGLGDEYTSYMSKEDWEEFKEDNLGTYIGLGVYMSGQENGALIEYVYKDSPADKNDIKEGDIITKVDHITVTKDNLSDATKYIRTGTVGTTFKVEVLRDGKTFTKTIKREIVRTAPIESEMLENNIGYMYIFTFDELCAQDFEENYKELKEQGAKELIIDLRNNTGGVLQETIDIAEMMLDKGDKILVSHNRENGETVYTSKTKDEVEIPVVVLMNEYSASASEVLAGALQDNKRAKIIGTKSYGKGVMQEVLSLSNGGALKITTEEFVSPNGNKINEVGITPDIEIEIPEEYPNIMYVPEDEDNQLKRAIEELKKEI